MAGAVLGASIFLVPSVVAAGVPFFGGIAAVWILGGLFSLAGALTYAELASMLPQAGGGYVYLREAFGPVAAFLFSWTDFLLVRAGAAAGICVGFGIYFSEVLPPPGGLSASLWQGTIAAILVLILGALNVLGTRLSGRVQVTGTVLKALAIGLLIALPWIFPKHRAWSNLQPLLPVRWSWAVLQSAGAAMVPVLWSYGGWDQLSHLAEEVRRPERNVPRAFGYGIAFVAFLYLGAALALHLVLPMTQVSASAAVGADFFRLTLGGFGVPLIAVIVMFSAATSAHMALMSGSRSGFAIARDGQAPAWLSRVHRRFATPANAIAALTFWSVLLIFGNVVARTGSRPLYAILISYVMFGMLVFQALVFAAAIRLRQLHPEWPRPYRVTAYPFTPIAGIVASAFLLLSMAGSVPGEAATGAGVILLGLPVYWIRAKRARVG